MLCAVLFSILVYCSNQRCSPFILRQPCAQSSVHCSLVACVQLPYLLLHFCRAARNQSTDSTVYILCTLSHPLWCFEWVFSAVTSSGGYSSLSSAGSRGLVLVPRPSGWAKWELVPTTSSNLRTSTVLWVYEFKIRQLRQASGEKIQLKCVICMFIKNGLPITSKF